MTAIEEFETIRGSGNVFQDLGLPNADLEHARVQLAAEIIREVRNRKLSQRKASALTGLTQPEVSLLKNAKLKGFTIDRLVLVLGRLDRRVEMRVVATPSETSVLEPA